MRFLAPAVLALSLFSMARAGGDLRFRLQRRAPDPRGILENYYTGDGWDFYSRLMYSSGAWGFTFLTHKARGEDWGDILGGGAAWTPAAGPVSSVSAGFLRADMGTGLVIAVPGSFSDISELSMYKPPNSRNRIRPATSPRGCRADPLTGAGVILSAGGLDISLLAALSPIDSLAGGYHRTPSEVLGRGALLEKLAAVRLARGGLGLTGMAASRNRGDGYSWMKLGTDWSADLGDWNSSGEVAVGGDSSGSAVAGWTALSRNAAHFRHMVTVLRNPEGFPAERSSAPVSRQCDIGVVTGFRWRVFPGAAVKAGAGAYFSATDDLLLASMELQYRFPWSMTGSLGSRTRTESNRFSWRSWLGSVWQPHDLLSIRTKVQLSGWNDSRLDSTESGSGLELKLRYTRGRGFRLDLGGAACSTDGYNSRVYAGGSSFPGVFSSTAIYGRTILLFSQLSVRVADKLWLRGAVSRRTVDGASSLGSGWEETQGDSRTDFGFQLDYAFQ
ncbi:MAG: hypothetical protein R6U39_08640 [Candidatus Aegiribacteria sp.]